MCQKQQQPVACLQMEHRVCTCLWPQPRITMTWSLLEPSCAAVASFLPKSVSGVGRKKQPALGASMSRTASGVSGASHCTEWDRRRPALLTGRTTPVSFARSTEGAVPTTFTPPCPVPPHPWLNSLEVFTKSPVGLRMVSKQILFTLLSFQEKSSKANLSLKMVLECLSLPVISQLAGCFAQTY